MNFRWEGGSVAIDFRLTARQRELQLQSRKFAREVLAPALEAEALPTPEERFAATRTAYEAIIAAGFLLKCIPLSAGGENAGLTGTAIMVEELYAANASVTLTLVGWNRPCVGASSLRRRQHRRQTSTTSRDLETAGIRSADDQR